MSIKLSIVYAFYNNHDMLARQLEHIASLPKDILDQIEYVFVDDGSASQIKIDNPKFNAQAFRIRRDIKWNQDGARNVGSHHARGEWLLLVDMDMIVTEELLRISLSVQEDKIYSYLRSLSGGELVSSSPNCFLIRKKRYWDIGGYDEDYRGTYGTDRLWRKRIGKYTELPVALINYMPDEIEDACTTNYVRDFGRKTKLKWLGIRLFKFFTFRGVRVLREDYDRVL